MPTSFIERIPRDLVRVGPQLRAYHIKCLTATRKQLTQASAMEILAWEMEVFSAYEFSPSLYVLAMSNCEKWRDAEQLTTAIDPDFNRKFAEAEQQLANMRYTPKIKAQAITPRCPNADCRQFMSMITSEQRRSADEGMTARYMCIPCEDKKKLMLSGSEKAK